jgi:hypothetical protein
LRILFARIPASLVIRISSVTGPVPRTPSSPYAKRRTSHCDTNRIELGESEPKAVRVPQTVGRFLKLQQQRSVCSASGILSSHTKCDSTISPRCTRLGIMSNCISNNLRKVMTSHAWTPNVKFPPSSFMGICTSRTTKPVCTITISFGNTANRHALTSPLVFQMECTTLIMPRDGLGMFVLSRRISKCNSRGKSDREVSMSGDYCFDQVTSKALWATRQE